MKSPDYLPNYVRGEKKTHKEEKDDDKCLCRRKKSVCPRLFHITSMKSE